MKKLLEAFRKYAPYRFVLFPLAAILAVLSASVLYLTLSVNSLRRAVQDPDGVAAIAASPEARRPLGAAGLSDGDTKRAYDGPIIDAHAHVFALDYFESLGWPDDPWTGAETPHYTAASLAEAVFESWDRYNVVKAVVSGLPEDVAAWKAKQPDRLISGILLGGEFAVKSTDLARKIERGEVEVLGELFSQYYGLKFDDPSLEKYYELAEDFDIPIGVHSGLSNPKEIADGGYVHFRAHLGNPSGMEEVLVRHKNMRVYLMHAGAPYLEDLDAIMSMYPNTYIDLASVLQYLPQNGIEAILKRLMIERDFGKRIMFGSDVYLWPDTQYRMSINVINRIDFLSYEQKADIFCNNAAAFFRLPAQTCQ